MIADNRGGFIAHRLAVEAKDEPFIPDERPLAFPIMKQGVVVFLRVKDDCTPIGLRSAVEDLLGTWPLAIRLQT